MIVFYGVSALLTRARPIESPVVKNNPYLTVITLIKMVLSIFQLTNESERSI
jgi:hypothetical protein